MPLITDEKDERIYRHPARLGAIDEHRVLLANSLRAALAAKEKAEAVLEEKDKRIETLTRWNNNAARLRDEAEAQLCGVKEIMSNVAFPCAVCEQVIDALSSSSSPCPHEEEAKRLREAIEWALTAVYGLDVIDHRFDNTQRRNEYQTELRRRADAGRGEG